MTTKENVGKAYMLSEIEKQIRKDIPRLMELREGCLIKDSISWSVFKVTRIEDNRISFGAHDGLISSVRYSEEEINSIERKKIDKFFTIIGHDIMLNDVFQWLFLNDNLHDIRHIFIDGTLIPKSGIIDYGLHINFDSPYLKDQSEELIKFLYKLIKE